MQIIKELCHLFVSVSPGVSGILLQPFWAILMTGSKLDTGCSVALGDGHGGRMLAGRIWSLL